LTTTTPCTKAPIILPEMSALAQLSGLPALGELFNAFTDLKELVENWSVKQKFSFKIADKDHERVIYTCVVPECQWRIRANQTEESNVKITVLNSEHNCLLGDGRKRYSVSSSLSWLRRHLPRHLHITQATKTQEIMDCLRVQFGELLPYKSASRIKNTLLEDTLEGQRDGFRLLSSYVAVIQQSNPATYIRLSSHHNTDSFQRLFICPAESQESFRHCLHFIAVDGMFLKTLFIQTLLLAVTIDSNGHTLLLAWAVVESENASSWEYFLLNLQLAIPEIITEATTLMSDRDKGLIAASYVLAPTVICAFCCQHLKDNFITRYRRGLASNFWAIAQAYSIAKYESTMLALQETKPAAAEYLQNIDPTL